MTRTRAVVSGFSSASLGMLLFGSLLAAAAGAPREMSDASGRRIDDTAPPDIFRADLERALHRFQPHTPQRDLVAEPKRINLVFHVLSGDALEGNVSDAALQDQLAVLNDTYRSSGLRFVLAEVRRYPASPYFAGGCFPTTEQGVRMKAELAVDPAHFVNIYTCRLDLPYIAGYGTLPNEFPENDPQHGVIIDYGTLPGSAAPLDLGHTLVHELGHYFGLFHTFQGGCAEPGDDVADTPAETSAAYGCEVGRDTCPDAGQDPIHNFMDYSDDRCTDNFTPLQAARIQASIAAFRPSLAATFAIGPGMTGNWFNPEQSGHGFSIEVLPGNQLLADWYVYAPTGGPVWIVASGPISGNSAVLQGFQEIGSGGRFPPYFDPAHLQGQLWGTITFTFTDCNTGSVAWQSEIAGYASGSMPIRRLTMPVGLSCP